MLLTRMAITGQRMKMARSRNITIAVRIIIRGAIKSPIVRKIDLGIGITSAPDIFSIVSLALE